MTSAYDADAAPDEDAYRLLFDANPQPMWVFDVETLGFLAVNDAAVANYGWSRDEFLAMTIRDIRPASDVPALEADVERDGGRLRDRGVWRHRKKNGVVFDVAISAHDLVFDSRQARLVVATDVTEQRRAEDALRRNEERFRLLAENAQDLVFRYQILPTPGFEYISPAAERILGYSTEELYGDPELVLKIVDDSHMVDMDAIGHDARFSEPRDVRVRRKDGTYAWIEERLTPVIDEEGHLAAVEGIASDISERKRVEATIAHQALHDALTQLPNRLLLLDRLSQALARTARDEDYVAVLLLDLDRFKLVNDSLGHRAGDELLMAVAARLRESVRPGDTVSRLGGDEFVVVCEGVSSATHGRLLGERLAALLTKSYQVAGTEVFASASIGVAIGQDGDSTEELLSDADAAMYLAKENGRGRVELFRPVLRERAENRLATEAALRHAVDNAEFVVAFQPIVDLDGGWVTGAEALARWRLPDHTTVAPAEFIVLAEETGLIVPIGDLVLRQACEHLRAWKDGFPNLPLSVAVNLSARQLNAKLLETLQDVLTDTDLEASCLTLEITESVLMEDVDAALEALVGLKAIGVSLSIDDFGTGYSSLSYLKRFPVDVLKIDQSFVSGLGSDEHDTAIVAGVLAMARGLRLDVVAEGVETEDQLRALRVLGCPFAQGYHFAPPLAPDELAQLLHEGPRW